MTTHNENSKPFRQFATADWEAAKAGVDARISEAVARLSNIPFRRQGLYIGHSGGKDSVLVTYLADRAFGFGNLPVIHNTKPAGQENAVHPRTIEFLYGLNRPIIYTPLGGCTHVETATQIDGTRISEFDRTDGRAVDLVINGQHVSREHLPLYLENGLFGRNFVYPIYDWQDIDVWAAIYTQGIPYSLEYDYFQGL